MNRFMAVPLIFRAAVFVTSVGLSAQTVSSLDWAPVSLGTFSEVAATVPKEIITVLRVGNMPVTLGQTMIDDVQKALGGIVGHQGDASESLKWICFQGGTQSGGNWVLWLESGEVDGGTVGGFQLRILSDQTTADKRCKVLDKSSIDLPFPVQLGSSERDLLKHLGSPTMRRDGKLFFMHQHEEMIRGELYDSVNTLTVLIRDGSVAAIEVWKTTTS